MFNLTPYGLVGLVWSFAGGGPINTPFGTGYVSPPYSLLRRSADAQRTASVTQKVSGSVPGLPIWFHGVDFTTATLCNPMALTVQ